MEERRSGVSDRDFIELFGIGDDSIYRKGLYIMSDPCLSLSSEIVKMYSKMIDIVDVRWNPPLILYPENIRNRVGCYRDMGCNVMASGELLENGLYNLDSDKILKNLTRMGFGYILLTERPYIEYKRIVELIGIGGKYDLKPVIKVFNVYRVGLKRRVEEYLSLGSYVIIPLDVEKYPQHFMKDGNVEWDVLMGFLEDIDRSRIIFQTGSLDIVYKLLNRVGLDINVYFPDLKFLIEFENMRLMILKESVVSNPIVEIRGGVAPKFVYYVLLHEGPKTVSQLMRITGLPLRTIQDALSKLRRQGLVKKVEQEGTDEAIWMSLK